MWLERRCPLNRHTSHSRYTRCTLSISVPSLCFPGGRKTKISGGIKKKKYSAEGKTKHNGRKCSFILKRNGGFSETITARSCKSFGNRSNSVFFLFSLFFLPPTRFLVLLNISRNSSIFYDFKLFYCTSAARGSEKGEGNSFNFAICTFHISIKYRQRITLPFSNIPRFKLTSTTILNWLVFSPADSGSTNNARLRWNTMKRADWKSNIVTESSLRRRIETLPRYLVWFTTKKAFVRIGNRENESDPRLTNWKYPTRMKSNENLQRERSTSQTLIKTYSTARKRSLPRVSMCVCVCPYQR